MYSWQMQDRHLVTAMVTLDSREITILNTLPFPPLDLHFQWEHPKTSSCVSFLQVPPTSNIRLTTKSFRPFAPRVRLPLALGGCRLNFQGFGFPSKPVLYSQCDQQSEGWQRGPQVKAGTLQTLGLSFLQSPNHTGLSPCLVDHRLPSLLLVIPEKPKKHQHVPQNVP